MLASVGDRGVEQRMTDALAAGLPAERRCDFLLSFGYPADPSMLIAPNRAGGRVELEALVHEERW